MNGSGSSRSRESNSMPSGNGISPNHTSLREYIVYFICSQQLRGTVESGNGISIALLASGY